MAASAGVYWDDDTHWGVFVADRRATKEPWRSSHSRFDGMSCGHCVKAVTMALQDLPGVDVKDVKVGQALIDADDAVVTTGATHGGHRGGRLHARVGRA